MIEYRIQVSDGHFFDISISEEDAAGVVKQVATGQGTITERPAGGPYKFCIPVQSIVWIARRDLLK